MMEKRGMYPELCDTEIPFYDGKIPCGCPTACYEEDGDVVLASIDGELTMKGYFKANREEPKSICQRRTATNGDRVLYEANVPVA
jgi:hypothetical protein